MNRWYAHYAHGRAYCSLSNEFSTGRLRAYGPRFGLIYEITSGEDFYTSVCFLSPLPGVLRLTKTPQHAPPPISSC